MKCVISLDSVYTLTQSKTIPSEDIREGKVYNFAKCHGLHGWSGQCKVLDLEEYHTIVVKITNLYKYRCDNFKPFTNNLECDLYGLLWKFTEELIYPTEAMTDLEKFNAAFQLNFTSLPTNGFLSGVNSPYDTMVDSYGAEARLREICNKDTMG